MVVCYHKYDYYLKNSFLLDKGKKCKAVPKLKHCAKNTDGFEVLLHTYS